MKRMGWGLFKEETLLVCILLLVCHTSTLVKLFIYIFWKIYTLCTCIRNMFNLTWFFMVLLLMFSDLLTNFYLKKTVSYNKIRFSPLYNIEGWYFLRTILLSCIILFPKINDSTENYETCVVSWIIHQLENPTNLLSVNIRGANTSK